MADKTVTTLKDEPTQRGFSCFEFTDGNGEKCSLQKSSAASREMIWLGCNEIGLVKLPPRSPPIKIKTPCEGPDGMNFVANNRMHLTQENVAALLPILQRFVDTGDIHE